MIPDEMIIDDDDDDSVAFGGGETTKIPVTCILAKDDFAEIIMRAGHAHPGLGLTTIDHSDPISQVKTQNPACVVLEIRMTEAFEDLAVVRDIRRERPLVPVVILSENNDPDFMLEGFKAGATDYITGSLTPDVFGFKLQSLIKLAESARLIEVQNAQLVGSMKAQREADEKRMQAEKEKSIAAAQAEANRQTKEILDNLNEGFFMVEKDGLKVGDTTSKSCASIFEMEIAGKFIQDALPLQGEVPQIVRAGLEQLFENFMPIEVNLSLIPKRWVTISNKIIEVTYTPILDDNGDPMRVIVAASDVTKAIEERKRLERTNAINRSLIQIMNDRSSFLEFQTDFKRDIDILATTDDIAVGKRILHTLKGNSAAYDLVDVADFVHNIEDEIASMTDSAPVLGRMHEVAAPILGKLQKFTKDHGEMLQLDSESESTESFTITGADLTTLEKLASSCPEEAAIQLTTLVNNLRKVPVSRLTKAFRQTVDRIAMRQKKSILYHQSGTDTLVDSRKYGSLFRNLIHAIRNGCDHGIETTEDRTDKGKKPTGFISLRVKKADDRLSVSLIDDGRGLNKDRIIAKAIEKGIIAPEAAGSISKEDWVQLIFAPGFSTAETVSNVSGRGIGMDCIKTEVERLGGTLSIKTRRDMGTQITIDVPSTVEAQEVTTLKLAS